MNGLPLGFIISVISQTSLFWSTHGHPSSKYRRPGNNLVISSPSFCLFYYQFPAFHMKISDYSNSYFFFGELCIFFSTDVVSVHVFGSYASHKVKNTLIKHLLNAQQ